MTLFAYDAAYEPDLAAVKANGGIAVSRYFVGNDSALQWKRVTVAQAAAIRDAGLGVIVNFEGGNDPLAGAASRGMSPRDYGHWAGQSALTDITACNVQRDGSVACYFSVDSNYDATKFAALAEYFQGLRDIMVPAKIQVKVYAEGAVIDFLVRTSLVDGKQWLAAPSSWPGFNRQDPNVCMVQLVGSPVSGTDQNEILDPHAIGAWWPAGSPYGGTMSATGPEHWDANDWNAIRQNWRADMIEQDTKVLRSEGVSGVSGQVAAVLRSEGVSGAASAVGAANQILAALADSQHGLSALADLVKAVPGGGAGTDPVALAQAISDHIAVTLGQK